MKKSLSPGVVVVILIVVVAIVAIIGWQTMLKKPGSKGGTMTPEEVKAKMQAGGMAQPKMPAGKAGAQMPPGKAGLEKTGSGGPP